MGAGFKVDGKCSSLFLVLDGYQNGKLIKRREGRGEVSWYFRWKFVSCVESLSFYSPFIFSNLLYSIFANVLT